MTSDERVAIVVTDDPRLRPEVEYGFPSDVSVRLAIDAREAWAVMRDLTPTVVIVDLQTGSAGGYGLRKDMLANDRLAEVPLLMLLERAQDGWLAKQAGASRWLVKPVEMSEMAFEAMALAAGGSRTSG